MNVWKTFSNPSISGKLRSQTLDLQDAEVRYYPVFFDSSESDRLKHELLKMHTWRQDTIKIFGREILQPRLSAWHGDPAALYTYSSLQLQPEPWTDTLLHIKSRIEKVTKTSYNSVLLNLYRDGQDSMGWHSDDEKELRENPVIASLTFGEARIFHFRHRFQKSLRHKITLENGSLLLMSGKTQHYWQHQVPKTKRKIAERMNLTFRQVYGK